MTRWLVTRHPGALAWAEHTGIEFDIHVEQLDPKKIQSGDIVIGSLPVNLVAQVCERGGRYKHLSLSLDRSRRGQELSLQEMQELDARLEEFFVKKLSENT